MVHKPVLLGEAIEGLDLKPGDTVVDGTLGAGGHSIEILKKILPGGRLISIDWDEKSIREFEKILFEKGIAVSANTQRIWIRPAVGRASSAPVTSNAYGEVISPLAFTPLFSGDKIVGYWCGANDNYSNLHKIVRELGVELVAAVLIDIGFSSDQIEDEKRGFSFLGGGPLDMRFSPHMQTLTAAEIVNNYPEKRIVQILREYGEERYPGRIARAIVEARKKEKISQTGQLVEIAAGVLPENYKKSRVHFATRIFQALRIEVNQELENLKTFLPQAVSILEKGGRLGVITFHSLEDRIVKKYFQQEARDCICPSKFPKCICGHEKKVKIISRKPISPSEQEIKDNPRARSAKLRIAEKI